MYDVKYIKGYMTIEEILKDKEENAKKISEGSTSLQKILLYCWDNTIETLSCCVGHELGEAAYIMLYVPYNQKELIYKILASVYNIKNAIITVGKSCNKDDIFIDIKSYWGGTEIFGAICESLFKEQDKNTIQCSIYSEVTESDRKEIVKIVELVNNFKHNSYNLRFEKNNGVDIPRYDAFIDLIDEDFGKIRGFKHEKYDQVQLIHMNKCFSDYETSSKVKQYIK